LTAAGGWESGPVPEPDRPPADRSSGLETESASPAGEPGGKKRVTKPPVVHYLGFRTTADGREYTLRVRDGLESRLFQMLITHADFASRLTRFQDAPDLCFTKLQRDLEADPRLLPGPAAVLTARDFLDYHHAREKRSPSPRRR
jgi:hypothetical protein